MKISGLKLTRQADDTVVLIEVSGRWVEVIREPYDGCFDHIVIISTTTLNDPTEEQVPP